jgi:hypothetical protein
MHFFIPVSNRLFQMPRSGAQPSWKKREPSRLNGQCLLHGAEIIGDDKLFHTFTFSILLSSEMLKKYSLQLGLFQSSKAKRSNDAKPRLKILIFVAVMQG